jgi:hypothetical protein
MDKNDNTRRQLIQNVLAMPDGAPAASVHAHSLACWSDLAAHLSPLIGEAGFCALYLRASSLTNAERQWPPAMQGARSVSHLLAALQDNLAALPPQQAIAANAALLDTFTKLLAGLIGEGLTTRLLNTAWADRSEGTNK